MKKITELDRYIKMPGIKKIIRVMKLTGLLLMLSVVSVFASKSYSQTKLLNLNLEQTTVKDVLAKIEDQSEFFFMYSGKVIDADRQVSVKAENQKIDVVLDAMFAGTDVDYTIRDRIIVLTTPEIFSSESLVSFQQSTVSGTVTDEGGEPLPGVTVVVKGTTQGTVTNADGEYSLTNISEDATLQFSFVGMLTQEIEVGTQTDIDVTMTVDAIGIEEVVAVGYGTARREDLTGSIKSADLSEVEEMPNVNIMQSMQGTVPGLNIGQVDAAGESPNIMMRGYNTLSTSASANQPLIVLDGSIFRGDISSLNPDNIESIDILKDISATAVYGAQAANGVMIISTKKGSDVLSKPILSYSAKYSFQTPNEHALQPMSGDERREFYKDIHWENSRLAPDYIQENPDYSNEPFLRSLPLARGYKEGLDIDWYDRFTSNGYVNNHNLDIRGKTKDVGYFVSASYTDEQGFRLNDEYTRYNFRMNFDFKINEWMSFAVESFLSASDYSGVEVNVFSWSPWAPIYNEDGEYVVDQGPGMHLNPYLQAETDDSDKRLNFMGNAHINIDIPFVKGLKYTLNYSNNYRDRKHKRFNPYGAGLVGSGFSNINIYKVWSIDNIINYKRSFNGNHDIDLTLLYGAEELEDENTYASAVDFDSDLLGYNALELGDPTRNSVSTGKSGESSLYQMGRLNYSFMDKYLLTGTIRRDGFSGFGTERKFGTFPSLALGWIISRESFFKEYSDLIDFLKLRVSYGTAGRRAVGRFQTRAKVNRYTSYIYGDGGSPVMGQYIYSMPNNKLGWEETTGINLGLDFNIFNRVRGTVDYYNNNTHDILYQIQLPNLTGFNSIPKNISEVHNNGIEFSLTGDIIQSSDFSWLTTINFSRNRNEIKKLLGTGDLVANELFIGEPQNVVYDYEITGIWQLNDDIPDGFFPGTYKIADLNNDGAYSGTDDKKILGYGDPSYRFSIINTLNYKNFKLHVVLNSIQGGKDYYYADVSPSGEGTSGSWYKLDQLEYNNVPKGAWDYWMPDNTDAKFRRPDLPSSYAPGGPYGQRNFVRLQDVSLSYTFDQYMIENLYMKGLKLYVSGKNLLTLTDWPGWDPETGTGLVSWGRPVMRSFTFGVNVEF